MLKLEKPVASFDLETTGTNITRDRIVEFGVVKVMPDGARREWSVRVNPGVPIPPEVQELIHISDADVKDCPRFEDVAAQIHTGLRGCDLIGYNLLNFDVPFLHEALHNAGINWDLSGVRIIDAGVIFKKREERTLSAAVKFFCGREHEDAHGALADARATVDVLEGQLAKYSDLKPEVGALAEYSKYDGEERIDLAGKLIRGKDGKAVYNFGKLKGQTVESDPSFAHWMLGRDFTADTLAAVCKVLDEIYERQVA